MKIYISKRLSKTLKNESKYNNNISELDTSEIDVEEKLDNNFISYEKQYNKKDKSIWLPIKLCYGGKRYSLLTKIIY